MSWSKPRAYFEARIAAVDSDFREHKDGFNIDNIPQFNKSFHLLPAPISSGPQSDNVVEDAALWEMRLFLNGFRDPQSAIDSIMNTGFLIRQDAISPANAKRSDDNIKDVFLVSATPTFVGTNDNAIILEMVFNVTMLYSGCG